MLRERFRLIHCANANGRREHFAVQAPVTLPGRRPVNLFAAGREEPCRDTVTEADETSRTLNLRDRETVEAIYRRDGPSVRGFLRRCLGDARAADDVLQDTFLELWRKPHGYDPARGSIRQFLFGVARRRAAQWRRDNPSASAVASAAVPRAAFGAADAVAIGQALAHLDEDARALLWLREVEGYSYAELASVLDVPVGTVRSRLFNARAALRRLWLGEHDRAPRSAAR